MENFFNYLSKPIPDEEVIVWFKINNIIPEKLELFYDFSQSLNTLINETYLGQFDKVKETNINLTDEDKIKHFSWCFNKVISNYAKEGIIFNQQGKHYDYFKNFFLDIFYNQKEEKVRASVKEFFNILFEQNKSFTKSDLDMVSVIYKVLNENMTIQNVY
jgi:hypothetical protein